MRLVQRDVVRPTPVFGTAQPVRGISGALRTRAYGIPEHRARHWLLLIVADRVDVVEAWLRERPARGATLVALLGGAIVAGVWLRHRR